MNIKITAEVKLGKRDIHNLETIKEDLLHELVKVKTGVYENSFFLEITDVEISKSAQARRR